MTEPSEEDRPTNGSPTSPSTPSGPDQPTPSTPSGADQPRTSRPEQPKAAEPAETGDQDRTVPIPESPGPMSSSGPLPPNDPLESEGPQGPDFASDSAWSYDTKPGTPPSRMGVEEERNWALAAHLGSFIAAYVALGFLCPLIVLLAKGKLSPFVRHHAIESLNFQLTALIAAIIAGLLVFVIIGLVLLPFLGIAYVVLVILASVAARRGEWYRYPVNIRFVR